MDIRKISSLKGLLSIGRGGSGKQLNHHPWRFSKNVWMWRLVTWFIGGLGSARVEVGLGDLRGLF